MRWVFVFAVALLLATSAQAQTLAFTLQGTNPNGKSGYTGTVDLTEGATAADGSWNSSVVTWNVSGAAPVKGLALQVSTAPMTMSVSFPGSPVPGVGIATVKRDGTVTLLWYIGGDTAGTELWTPKK